MLYGVDIFLFPKIGNRSIEIHADVDENMPYSIVQKSLLEDWQLQYALRQEPKFTDKRGRTHTPIGHVELQWHKAGFLLENTETFYVVDSGAPIVALKHAGDKATDSGIRPVGLGAQTPGKFAAVTTPSCNSPLSRPSPHFTDHKCWKKSSKAVRHKRRQRSKRNEMKRKGGKRNEIERSNRDNHPASNAGIGPHDTTHATYPVTSIVIVLQRIRIFSYLQGIMQQIITLL